MATKLVIVESAAKAKTIGKLLGRSYKVEASNGHIRDLPKSQLGVDVEDGFTPKYITIRGRGEIVDRIRRQAKDADKIFLATDPDREGEAISWHLAHVLHIDPNKACRIVFHEITGSAIKNAVQHPRKIDLDLVDAQQARRILDRLVGYQISPLLWAKVRKGLSAGRVQSVAARIICDREEEIGAFRPQEYWSVHATFGKDGGLLQAVYDEGKEKLDSKEKVDALIAALPKSHKAISVKSARKSKHAMAPFTTSTLQQEAARKLNFTTKRTMLIAQQLYEGVSVEHLGTVGLVTYIRTDSVNIAAEAQAVTAEFIRGKYGAEYCPEKPNQYKNRARSQEAHEAIRPTMIDVSPESVKASLTRDQYRLYKLIFTRYLASQMTPAVYDTKTVLIGQDKPIFRAYGSRLAFQGYRVVYNEVSEGEEEVEGTLPPIEEGDALILEHVEGQQHFTEPPPHYTEASLVRALEEKGIGRPSTYSPIITTILDRGYVRREGKVFQITELGQIVTNLMKQYFGEIVDVAFTADMEAKLDAVEEGSAKWRQIVTEFYASFEKTLQEAEKHIEKIEIKDEVTDTICEQCGANMVIKIGRYGKFLACPKFPECRNTKPIVQEVDVPCPQCGNKVVQRRSRKGKVFYGCERYPDCDFVSWDMPMEEKCPNCGGYLVKKAENAKGETRILCPKEGCGYSRVEIAEEKKEQTDA